MPPDFSGGTFQTESGIEAMPYWASTVVRIRDRAAEVVSFEYDSVVAVVVYLTAAAGTVLTLLYLIKI